MTQEFGDFELDASRRVLKSLADGKPVEITGRVLDALIYLVERPGQLIDKKTLIDALWPNVVVEDGNLTQTIHTLRRVLGEKAGEHRYIVTVPGRGYQFVAEVRERAVPVAPVPESVPRPASAPDPALEALPRRRRTWVLAVAALAILALVIVAVLVARPHAQPPVQQAAVVAHPSIAVLPFVDMSEEQNQAHFADGLSEEILNILAHADNLRVTARTSSFSFKGENVDIKTIAHRLNVSHVLEGSVRKSGDRLRITAQLIDASTSAHVWSDVYDRDVHDVFGVQREIATAVADALRVKLASAAPRPAETSNPEAYDHYLQGKLLFNRRAGSDLEQARTHFATATQLDPDYARAWAALAGAYFVLHYAGGEPPDAMEKWHAAAERAVALAPDLAEAQIRLAQYEITLGKVDVARPHLERARQLDPGDPLVLSIGLSDAIYEGRIADAIEIQRRVVAIDPLSASHRGNLGAMLTMAGRLPEALAEMERSLELSPAAESSLMGVADVLILQGRADEAFKVIAQMPESFRREERLALAHFVRGDTPEGEALLGRLRMLAQKRDADPAVSVAVAEVYAFRKDADRAFEWIDRARPHSRDPLHLMEYWSLRETLQATAYFNSLHTDPRWNTLLTELDQATQ